MRPGRRGGRSCRFSGAVGAPWTEIVSTLSGPARFFPRGFLLKLPSAVPIPEGPKKSSDDDEHSRGADPADRGGVALEPVADLECLIPHIHRPRVGGQCAVKAAEDEVLV